MTPIRSLVLLGPLRPCSSDSAVGFEQTHGMPSRLRPVSFRGS